MQRREALRLIASVAAVPVFSGIEADRLWAIAEGTHARARAVARTLNAQQLETVATIAELIFPRTSTPGARQAGVPAFIDLLMGEWYSEEERTRFTQGLAAIDARSQSLGGKAFVGLTASDQLSVMQALDAAEKREPATAESAYGTIKSLTVYGYFTSKLVSTTVLKTNIWPGRYDGCVPV